MSAVADFLRAAIVGLVGEVEGDISWFRGGRKSVWDGFTPVMGDCVDGSKDLAVTVDDTGTVLCREELGDSGDWRAWDTNGESREESEGSSELESAAFILLPLVRWDSAVRPENRRVNSGPNSFSRTWEGVALPLTAELTVSLRCNFEWLLFPVPDPFPSSEVGFRCFPFFFSLRCRFSWMKFFRGLNEQSVKRH